MCVFLITFRRKLYVLKILVMWKVVARLFLGVPGGVSGGGGDEQERTLPQKMRMRRKKNCKRYNAVYWGREEHISVLISLSLSL